MYKETAKGYEELYKEEQINKLKIIEQYLIIKPHYKLLDIGCGTGISTNYFKCKTFGIDNEIGMIKQGKGNLKLADAHNMPFKDKTFDIITCITAVHHFKDLDKFIGEVKRLIKPNGKIVITILKKSPKFLAIKHFLLRSFEIEKELDEEKDLILILKP